jgi:metallo-beta-lactamase class B
VKKKIILLFLLFSNFTFGQYSTALRITPLKGDFYIYETFKLFNNSLVGANGMYLVTNEGVVLFDSPWDTIQAEPLLDSIYKRHNKKVILSIATHFHADRTGSFEIYNSKNIATYTSKQTDSLCLLYGEKRATNLFKKDTVFNVGQYSFKTFYPGKGHAPDNIIIWFEKEKILYGGCFIKSYQAADLGNLSDANVTEWKTSIEKTITTFGKPKYIIPGHQSWKKRNSLQHTLKLIKDYLKKNAS